jgi:hypothetical protein
MVRTSTDCTTHERDNTKAVHVARAIVAAHFVKPLICHASHSLLAVARLLRTA